MCIIMKDQKTPHDKAYFCKPKKSIKQHSVLQTQDEKEYEDGQKAIIAVLVFVLIMLFIIMPAILIKHNQPGEISTYWQFISSGSQ